jgi:hypothetical protein
MDFSEFRPSFAHHPHRIFNINSFLNRLFLYHIIIIDFSEFQPAFAHHPPFARRRAVYFFSFNCFFSESRPSFALHPSFAPSWCLWIFFIFHFIFVFFCPSRLSVFSSRGQGWEAVFWWIPCEWFFSCVLTQDTSGVPCEREIRERESAWEILCWLLWYEWARLVPKSGRVRESWYYYY